MNYLNTFLIILICASSGCEAPDDQTYETLNLGFVVTHASTATAADGAINLTITGGNPPMTHSWSNGASTEDIDNLVVGTYTVSVTSDDGQTVTDSAAVSVAPEPGSPTDFDGNTYTTIQIGTQLWMAENFKGMHTASGEALTGANAYNDDDANVEIYGRLYTWEAALDANPSGWHLPSAAEWDVLITAVGSNPVEKLVDGGSTGFNVKFGGIRNSDDYGYLGVFGAFWTATQSTSDHAATRLFAGSESNVIMDNDLIDNGKSVRYIRD
ncbi:FISUMP domain-containing protein [Candidatus Neomarinimicrobiota bacterium]